ncbi:hypothetical protein LCGC14_0873340 [marine sediment metagenome]|uniref:Uncharacterized protein n=1 Tax=marine sediment metagenome TaxID=412755 RepID=A0A0F9RNM9_9ZZZZ
MIELQIVKTIYAQFGAIHTTAIAGIVRALRECQPDKPEDKTSGFIAYNVPGKARMKMKTGRFLVRKLKLNTILPDSIVQRLASEINADLFPGFGIRLDTGDGIRENYRNEVGGSACMSDSNCGYVGLYCDNPERISQLIIEQNGDSARAIVWKLDDGRFFMDRVYCTCEYLRDQIRQYSKARGWILRSNDAPRDTTPISLVVSDLDFTEGEVPWLDTLKQYNIENGKLTVGNQLSYSMGELQNQDGSIKSGPLCTSCNEVVNEDCCHFGNASEIYCENCYHELFYRCDKCNEDISIDDIIMRVDGWLYWCDFCVDLYAMQCKECSGYFTDAVYIDGDEHCMPCAEQYPICNDCGKYTKEVDQCGYCADCEEEHINEIPCKTVTSLLFLF